MTFKYNPITGQLDETSTGGGGGGDVVGPASSTDNDLAAFDGATGKLLKDSGTKISDILLKADNLAGLTNAVTARSNLGLGTIAVLPDPLTETHGGTGQTSYTVGDLLYSSSANTLGKLSISTASGSPLGTNGSLPVYLDPKKYIYFFDDFLRASQSNAISGFFINTNNNGGGSGSGANQENGSSTNPGVILLQTGTGTTGSAALSQLTGSRSTGWMVVGGGTWEIEWLVKLTTLSDGTNTYTMSIGWGDITLSSDSITNGIYFSYTDTGSSPNWKINTTSASSTTTQDSGVAASTAAYNKFKIIVNAAGTSVSFYINGTQVSNSPLTTTIPSVVVGGMLKLIKSAGATNRTAQADYCTVFGNLTASR